MTKKEWDFIVAIQATLCSSLVPKEYKGRPENPMFGHCYGAAEALYHLLGGKCRGYKAQRAIDCDGFSHWWIMSPTGEILDPTAAQYTDFDKIPPYTNARGAAFRRLSKRAQVIMERVSMAMITG